MSNSVRKERNNHTNAFCKTTQIDAEDMLQASEEIYRALMDNASVAIILTDADENIFDANKTALELTGYAKADLVGMSVAQLYSKTDFEQVKTAKEENLTGSFSTNDLSLIRKDGKIVPIDLACNTIEYQSNRVCQMVISDITEHRRDKDALLEAKERIDQVYRVIPSAIFTVDTDSKVTSFNKEAEMLTGYTPDEVIGKKCTTFALEPCATGGCGLFQCEELDEPIIGKICSVRRKDGVVRTISKNMDHIRDLDGNVVGGVESFEDITERYNAEEKLRKSEERYRTLAEAAHDMIFIIDVAGRVQYINGCAASHLKIAQEEGIGKTIEELFPQKLSTERGRNINKVFETGEPLYSEGMIESLEDNVWLGTWLTPIRNDWGKVEAVLGISRDITERKNAEETIRLMAYYDPLTNLPNRALFNDRLSLALARARRNNEKTAVLFLDLDNFKTINDTLGHAVGDQLLQGVAERLKECVREEDTVARLGGDEFVILLLQTDQPRDVARIAKKILEVVKPPFNLNNRDLHITTSIGIALYPSDGKDAQTLLRNADTALYRVKEHGRNNYQLYTPSMNAKAFRQLALESGIRDVLDKKEFEVHYQPLVDLGTSKIIGMEALLRWNHPDLGMVYPAEFISIAEETGLIVPIGEWVLKTACKQNKTWQLAGFPHIQITVNLSARQFQQDNLVEMIKGCLKETRLNPKYLELEITESVVMKDARAAVEKLQKLKLAGIKVSIDDFGTGYSSLSYLKVFPIDNLKIDRSFICDITNSPDDAAIVTAIITLGHSLGLKTIAEGVESDAQLECLRSLKCDAMQGYIYSRPLPVEEATKLLSEEKLLCA